jgi:Protein of unknown function (DUF2924)
VRRWREPAAIAAEIERIRLLRSDALRRHWQLVFGRAPPSGLSKDLLGRMIAAGLQEQAFGGKKRSASSSLMPGTALISLRRNSSVDVATPRTATLCLAGALTSGSTAQGRRLLRCSISTRLMTAVRQEN